MNQERASRLWRISLDEDKWNAEKLDSGSISEAQVFSRIEARTLAYSAESVDAEPALKGYGPAALFFHFLSKEFGPGQEEAMALLGDSPMRSLGQPVCMIEMRRDRKRNRAFVHYPELDSAHYGELQHDKVSRYLQLLHDQQLDHSVRPLEDGAFDRSLSQTLNLDAITRNLSGDDMEPPDRLALLRPLSEYLFEQFRQHRPSRTEKDENWSTDTNAFVRAHVIAWLEKVYRKSKYDVADGEDGARNSDRFTDAIDVLPVTYVASLNGSPDITFLISITPSDPWFIDESIPEDIANMPDIFIGVFQAPPSVPMLGDRGQRELEAALDASLGALHYKLMSRQRGEAIRISSGEGSKIARAWFGQGVSGLLGKEASDARLKNETTLDFWTRFVEELLCMRIEGVLDTETFPFDRAFIIPDTGAEATQLKSGADAVRIRVLEAALESQSPIDRFQTRASFERVGRDLNREFAVTLKSIKYKHDFDLVRNNRDHVEMSELVEPDAYVANSERTVIAAGKLDRRTQLAEMAIESIISSGPDIDIVNVEEYREANEAGLRRQFTREGFLYDFVSRSDFDRDFPLLSAINKAYVDRCGKIAGLQPQELEQFWAQQSTGDIESKVVVLSFEPLLSQENKRERRTAGEDVDAHYLPPDSNKFTIILIADDDPEKSIPDLEAEREDLKLLVQMICRQRLRDRKREIDFLERRVDVVSALMDSLVHKMKIHIDKSHHDELDAQWNSVRKTVRFDRTAMDDIPAYSNGARYLARIWLDQDPDCDEILQFEDGMLEERLEKSVAERIAQYAENYLLAHGREAGRVPVLSFHYVPIPNLTLQLPVMAVRECLDVALKNAVEASLGDSAPSNAEVRIVVQASFNSATNEHSLDLTVENTSAPVAPDIWARLTSRTPQKEGLQNNQKKTSTGVGVYASRQLLQNGLGSRADMRYFRLSADWVQARIQLPAKLAHGGFDQITSSGERATKEDTDFDQLCPDILILEDSVENSDATVEAIGERSSGLTVKVAETAAEFERMLESGLPKLIISDLNVPRGDGEAGISTTNGVEALEFYGALAAEAGHYPPVWIATNLTAAQAVEVITDPRSGKCCLGEKYKPVTLNHCEDPLASGQVVILSMKHLKETARGGELADMIGARLSPANSAPEASRVTGPAAAGTAQKLTIKRPHLDKFDEKYLALLDAEPRPDFVLADARMLDLYEAVDSWMRLPSLPLLGGRSPTPRPVFSPSYHSRLAMVVSNTQGEVQLAPSVRYWLLNYNIVAAPGDPQGIAEMLAGTVRENSGAVAITRHDLLNLHKENPGEVERLTRDLQSYLEDRSRSLPNVELRAASLSADERKELLSKVVSEEAEKFEYGAAEASYLRLRNFLFGLMEAEPAQADKISAVAEKLHSTMMLVGLADG
jgi:CheY-like chemotaxis protein